MKVLRDVLDSTLFVVWGIFTIALLDMVLPALAAVLIVMFIVLVIWLRMTK
jgi:hypothetical protein